MDSKIEQLIGGHRDAVTVKRVFGDPYEKNGVTVIPAAKVLGGGGGGEGESQEDPGGSGMGTGFGLAGRPVGAFVIRGDEVTWQPAVDVNRIVAGALTIVALSLILKRRRRR